MARREEAGQVQGTSFGLAKEYNQVDRLNLEIESLKQKIRSQEQELLGLYRRLNQTENQFERSL